MSYAVTRTLKLGDNGVTQLPRRLLIVDASTLLTGDGDNPTWSAEEIAEVIAWSDLSGGTLTCSTGGWDGLVIATNRWAGSALLTPSFTTAWEQWVVIQAIQQMLPDFELLIQIPGNTPQRFGITGASLVSILLLDQDWFDNFESPNQGWLEAFRGYVPPGNFDLDRWEAYEQGPNWEILDWLRPHLSGGEVRLRAMADDSGRGRLQEIVLISPLGRNLRIHTFKVPVVSDTPGDMP